MSAFTPHSRLPLQNLSLAPSSLKKYNRALVTFLTHTHLHFSKFLLLSPSRLDRLLSEFLQYGYSTGMPFAYAANTLHCAVWYRPELRRLLPVTRQCLKGWERVRPTQSYPPLTWELTVLLASSLLRSGYHGPAISLLLAFDCYLRVSELLGLRRCDIVMPSDARMGRASTGMAVILPRTKTGLNQSVPLQDPVVAQVLCAWMHAAPPRTPADARVFPYSQGQLRRLMRAACLSHGLVTRYVPHSLRHGGATADFLRTNSVEHVQFRGRWRSMESTRRYVQASRALLAAQQVPQRVAELGALLSDSLLSNVTQALARVPQVPLGAPGRRVTFRC